MMNGWDMTGWGWGWMTIWSLPIIVLIGVLIAAALRSGPDRRSSSARDSAEAVLRRRYATGEIDESEFNRRRAVLEDERRELVL